MTAPVVYLRFDRQKNKQKASGTSTPKQQSCRQVTGIPDVISCPTGTCFHSNASPVPVCRIGKQDGKASASASTHPSQPILQGLAKQRQQLDIDRTVKACRRKASKSMQAKLDRARTVGPSKHAGAARSAGTRLA